MKNDRTIIAGPVQLIVVGPPADLSSNVMHEPTKDLVVIPPYILDHVTDVRSASEMSMLLESGSLLMVEKSRHIGESLLEKWAAKHWELLTPDFVATDFRSGLTRNMLWTKYHEYTKAQIKKFIRRRC